MSKIIIVGPASPLRGGIADFNESLALELISQNIDVEIISFSLQYPKILFPGKTQFDTSNKINENLKIQSLINSINPFSWYKTAKYIIKQNPDTVLFRFWIPFMGPCLGTIASKLKKKNIPVYAITDNVIPHERRIGDKNLTRFFLKRCDGFITMSKSVCEDITSFTNNQKKLCLFHPIYDVFGKKPNKEESLSELNLPNGKYLLFFGLIREYKGLELAIEAMSHPKIKEMNLKLLVAGEFYSSKEKYLKLIEELNLDNIILHDHFIPKEKVKYYFGATDSVVQPYISATQSGITQVAYNFDTPMIVTNVGGLDEIVEDGIQGYVCEVNSSSVAQAILKLYNEPENIARISKEVAKKKQKFSWSYFVKEILVFMKNTE